MEEVGLNLVTPLSYTVIHSYIHIFIHSYIFAPLFFNKSLTIHVDNSMIYSAGEITLYGRNEPVIGICWVERSNFEQNKVGNFWWEKKHWKKWKSVRILNQFFKKMNGWCKIRKQFKSRTSLLNYHRYPRLSLQINIESPVKFIFPVFFFKSSFLIFLIFFRKFFKHFLRLTLNPNFASCNRNYYPDF